MRMGWSELRWALLFVILIVSIPGNQAIPFHRVLGLDLQNLFAFHNCQAKDQPYLVPGATCGDLEHRGMYYPPILYWSFVWLRLVSFETARWLWSAVVVVSLLLSFRAWVRLAGSELTFMVTALCALLLVQFPVVFALERGNSDAIVVALWSLGVAAFFARRMTLAGVLLGFSACFKVYPAVALLPVAGAMVKGMRRVDGIAGVGPRGCRNVLLGIGLSGLISVAVAPQQHLQYLQEVLPTFAAYGSAPSHYSHALTFIAEASGSLVHGLVRIAVVAVWIVAALRCFDSRPVFIFAGAVASSVYVAGVSFDYNLVAVFPLLLVVALAPKNAVEAILGLAFALAVMGNRAWLVELYRTHPEVVGHHVVAQVFFLVAIACCSILTFRGQQAGEGGARHGSAS